MKKKYESSLDQPITYREYFKPLCGKTLQDTQKEAKTVVPGHWWNLYMADRDWLKGSHMTKGSLASE